MKPRSWLVLILVLFGGRSAGAIMGCLTELEDLVPRATTIITGKIDAVEPVELPPCAEGDVYPAPERVYSDEYRRCGRAWRLSVSVHSTEKGKDAPPSMSVFVAPESILVLSCDDRPEVRKMKGLEALFFLESEDDRHWTLDGPNSIYLSRTPYHPDDGIIRDLHRLVSRKGGQDTAPSVDGLGPEQADPLQRRYEGSVWMTSATVLGQRFTWAVSSDQIDTSPTWKDPAASEPPIARVAAIEVSRSQLGQYFPDVEHWVLEEIHLYSLQPDYWFWVVEWKPDIGELGDGLSIPVLMSGEPVPGTRGRRLPSVTFGSGARSRGCCQEAG